MLDKTASKILLFGEYTILYESSALAIANHLFNGHWVEKGDSKTNQAILQKSFDYLKEHKIDFLDLQAFQNDINEGLNFETNIPIGYGVGSSGAVSAAIYKRYADQNKPLELQLLRKRLQTIENQFHGNSSGMDPLVSYLDKTILLNNGEITLIEDQIKFNNLKLFLVDTGHKRSTAPLVKIFKEKMKDEYFNKNIQNQLIELVEIAIQSYLSSQEEALFKTVHEISNFQYRFFEEMILPAYKSIWRQALASSHYKLKLCGAGGGGFILGFSNDEEQTAKSLEESVEKIIWLD